MNNSKAIAASVAMVMAAAIGTGGLVAWQQSSAAAPVISEMPEETSEVVVEYVDAPSELDAAASSTDEASPNAESADAEASAYEEGDDEAEDTEDYEDGDEAEEDEDRDDD